VAYDLIGKNFTPPDVRAKVTGKAKYAEDFRVDGMVFCRLLLSTIPHARVKRIDVSEALEMEGVLGVLLPEDLVPLEDPLQPPVLTDEPKYIGEPIAAVAAVNETVAHDALEKIHVEYEPLPFVIDPLESLYPGGPAARTEGNVANRAGIELQTFNWTEEDFASVEGGTLPKGKPAVEWSAGDLDAGFANAKYVVEETFVTGSNPHHSMEPRTAMAYWQNGKCYVHGSTQSQSMIVLGLGQYLGIEPSEVVYIAEYCGGGFGSKAVPYPIMAVPGLMSKKIGRPVMMRISRSEEYFLGSARHCLQGSIKLGFNEDGRVAAADIYCLQANGPYAGFPDFKNAAQVLGACYSPLAIRFRGVPVLTNTPPAGAQRGPGQNQFACIVEPIMDQAAEELGLDRLAIRMINAPSDSTRLDEKQTPMTSAFLADALQMAAAKFDWDKRKLRSRQRSGSKVTGIGIGSAMHPGGFSGFDGLVRILPDGKLYIHTGVGNLGTYSYAATSRVAAEILKYDWEDCVIIRGDSSKHLPWNSIQAGSNTSYTQSRTNYVAAMDAVAKLKEIAAMDLGGSPDDYEIDGRRVFRRSNAAVGLSYGEAAQRAIDLGGKFSGQEGPEDVFFLTKMALGGVAGSGLVGVAKDNMEVGGTVPTFTTGFIEIELDIETGRFEIKDYFAATDCGTVIHPQGLETQIKSGAVMGFGLAATERAIYDPQNGLPGNTRLIQTRPPSGLDVPSSMTAFGVDKPDPSNPVGVKGMGEPPLGAGASALLSAISDALGGHMFNRTPVTPDMIINAANGRLQSNGPLSVFTA
jgi:xanthine dehydrogenase molybdenum-binding subunit